MTAYKQQSFFNQKQIEYIVSCAFDAGEIAARAQKSANFQVMKKADNSKVTTADIAVSKFINQKLSQKFPEITLVCEEGNVREVDDVFWLIDPIDGTGGFIEGIPEFAVNIALVKNQRAVFGLIYAPLFEGGKMIFSNHQNQVVATKKSGENKVLSAKKLQSDLLRIVTSPRTKTQDIENYTAQFWANQSDNICVERLSSAVKFFRILENDADLYLHFRQSMEWDTAAGQALVELMNGEVKTVCWDQDKISLGENLTYKKTNFLNQPFITFIN